MLFQYRVLEMDDDGDPLDHGVVRADHVREACALVAAHLRLLVELEADDEPLTVRFYPLRDAPTGVLRSAGAYTESLIPPEDA
jgi:hypothetical protein